MGDGMVVEIKLMCELGVYEGNDNVNCVGGCDLLLEVDVFVVGCGFVGVVIGVFFGWDGVCVFVVDRVVEIFMVLCVIVFDNDVFCIL